MAPGRLKGDVSRVRVSDFTSIPVLITAGRCAIPSRAHQPFEEEPHRLCDPIGFATASCTDNTRRSRVATGERPAILAFWPSHWTRMIPQGCPARGCSSGSLRSPHSWNSTSRYPPPGSVFAHVDRAGEGLAKCLPAHRSWPNSLRRPGLSQGATSCLLTAVGERGTERHL